MKVFIGYGYNDRDKWIPKKIIPFIEQLGHKCLTGEKMQGERLSEGVLKRIKESHAVIGFLTKRDRIEGQNTYTTHKWVTDELAIAVGKNISVYEIREKNIEMQRGFTGDRQSLIIDDIADKEVIFEGIKDFLNNVSKKREKLKRIKLAVIAFIILILCLSWYFKNHFFSTERININTKGEIPVVVKGSTLDKKDIPEIDSLISGSIRFKAFQNMDYNLQITPFYIDGDPSTIESITNVTESVFQDTLVLKQKEFYVTIESTQDHLEEWVLSSTGNRSIPYEPDQTLLFKKKDWYFQSEMSIIEQGTPEDKKPRLERLSQLDWVEENIHKWFRLKQEGCEYFWKQRREHDLYSWCQKIERHKNFELLQLNRKQFKIDTRFYIFHMWRKSLRRMIEEKFDSLDETYVNIGQVSLIIIEMDEDIKSKTKYLMNRYNKHYGPPIIKLTEEGLKFLLNV